MSVADEETELPSFEETELLELSSEQGEEDDEEEEGADVPDGSNPLPVPGGASRVFITKFPAINPKTTMTALMILVRRKCGGMAGL